MYICRRVSRGGARGLGPPSKSEKQKKKKKKAFRFWAPPPLRIPGHAPDMHAHIQHFTCSLYMLIMLLSL